MAAGSGAHPDHWTDLRTMGVIRISRISAIDLHVLPMAVPMPGLLTCGGIPSPSHQDECFECADRHHGSCVAKELWRPWADTLSSGMYQKGGGFVKVEAWAGGVRTGWVVGVYHLRSLLESSYILNND